MYELIERGQIEPRTMVWNESLEDWLSALEVDTFRNKFDALPSANPLVNAQTKQKDKHRKTKEDLSFYDGYAYGHAVRGLAKLLAGDKPGAREDFNWVMNNHASDYESKMIARPWLIPPINIRCDNEEYKFDIAQLEVGKELQVCGNAKVRIKRIIKDFVMSEGGTPTSKSNAWNNPAVLIEYPLPDGSTKEAWHFTKFPNMHDPLSYSSQEKGFVLMPR